MKIRYTFVNRSIISLSLCSFLLTSCATLQSQDQTQSRENLIPLSTPNHSNVNEEIIKKYNSYHKDNVSLQEAAQLIVLFHPRASLAKSDENTEAEMIAIAEAAYYPQISGGLGARRESEVSSRYDKRYIQDIGLSISQVLYDFGKISNSVKSAEYRHSGSQVKTQITNNELINLSSLAVITANRSKQLSALAKEQVNSVSSLTKLVEDRQVKGAGNLSDVYQAKSRLDNVLSEELDINTQHQSVIRSLGVMIGQRQITDAMVDKLPSSIEAACFTTPTWDNIPEYELAQIEAEIAATELELAKANELPTISLTGNASKPLNATPRYGSSVDTKIGINVSVPVYQGGALSAGKRVAESRIESANARRAEIQLDIEQGLNEAQINLQNLIKRKDLLEQRVANLKNTKDLYKQQYLELGTRTLVDLLNSEQEYHHAQVDVVNNRFDIIQTQLNCAYRKGQLVDSLNIYTN